MYLRSILICLVTALAIAAFVPGALGQEADTTAEPISVASVEPAVSVTPEELSGTWNVTIKPTGLNTCDRGKPKLRVFQWLVSVNGNRVHVSVLGGKHFPKLKGRIKDGRIFLGGKAEKAPDGETVKPSVVHVLDVKDAGTVSGDHHLLAVTTKSAACMTTYKVMAKKQ